jgi:hypothetical protein
MGILDYVLFPIYAFLFYLLFKSRRMLYTDPILQKYHRQSFWIKVIATVGFTIFNYKISLGDSVVLYWREGYNIYHLILHDISNIKLLFIKGKDYDQALLADMWNAGYFNDENNYMVTKIVAALSFITFGKYMVINLFFSMISFSGVFRLYRFFYGLYPHLHKQLAMAILYLPTFVFWSSGILKDPICTGAVGWITYSLYDMLYKKNNILKNTFIVLVASYFLVNLKIYILISYVPFFVLFIILSNVKLIKNPFTKFIIGPCLIIGCIFAGQQVMKKFQGELGIYAAEGLTDRIKSQQKNYQEQAAAGIGESNFSLGVEFDGSISSLLKMAPAAIIATLYRPFIWETRKLSTLLSSFESLALMILTLSTLFKVGPRHFFRTIGKDPVVLYCFLFSLLFALFVGATTPNFGTLCRYKIPCMPFYVIAMILIRHKYAVLKEAKSAKKETLMSGFNFKTQPQFASNMALN